MISIDDYKNKVAETVSFLKSKMKQAPSVVIILGTGLGGLVDSIEDQLFDRIVSIAHM